METERLAFIAEWFDAQASLTRSYNLLYFPREGAVELIDLKLRKIFLKKTKLDNVKKSDLFIGASVNIFGRQMTIVDYGDDVTRNGMATQREQSLVIIKPDCFSKAGLVIDLIQQNDFIISNLRSVHLSPQEAQELYVEHRMESYYSDLIAFMSSGPCIALELLGDGAIGRWRDLIGPSNPAQAKEQNSHTLRARLGKDIVRNAVHGSKTVEEAARECEFFFGKGSRFAPTALMSGSVLGLIKPHAVSAKLAGKIIHDVISNNFQITAIQMFSLDTASAEEFLEVYKGVVAEYPLMVQELCSGSCIAFEVSSENGSLSFRDYCGPLDPEIGRHVRKHSLRAKYGESKVRNAVHCTDLPEDGILEVEYFFRILQN